VPVRLEAAETACSARQPNAEVADKTAEAAMAEVTPIDDVRSTAAYRRFVLGRVVRRMILDSAEK
jgi:CO/xanthine dehydrogenase FAD-binding subunit